MADIQLSGLMKFGATSLVSGMVDYSAEISKLVLHLGANKVARKPTYGDPRMYSRPGARQDTLEVVTDSDFNTSGSFMLALMTAFLTPTKLMYFTAKYYTTTTSATNNVFSGAIMVDSLDFGEAVGDLKEFSKTFDLIYVNGPLTTDPTNA